MNEEQNRELREQWEVRIVALLLGESSAFETAEIELAMQRDPELAAFHAQIRRTIELTREASKEFHAASQAAAGQPRLSAERREALLARFKQPKVVAAPVSRPARRRWRWLVPASIAAGLVALAIAISMPNFTRARKPAEFSVNLTLLGNQRAAVAKLFKADGGLTPSEIPAEHGIVREAESAKAGQNSTLTTVSVVPAAPLAAAPILLTPPAAVDFFAGEVPALPPSKPQPNVQAGTAPKVYLPQGQGSPALAAAQEPATPAPFGHISDLKNGEQLKLPPGGGRGEFVGVELQSAGGGAGQGRGRDLNGVHSATLNWKTGSDGEGDGRGDVGGPRFFERFNTGAKPALKDRDGSVANWEFAGRPGQNAIKVPQLNDLPLTGRLFTTEDKDVTYQNGTEVTRNSRVNETTVTNFYGLGTGLTVAPGLNQPPFSNGQVSVAGPEARKSTIDNIELGDGAAQPVGAVVANRAEADALTLHRLRLFEAQTLNDIEKSKLALNLDGASGKEESKSRKGGILLGPRIEPGERLAEYKASQAQGKNPQALTAATSGVWLVNISGYVNGTNGLIPQRAGEPAKPSEAGTTKDSWAQGVHSALDKNGRNSVLSKKQSAPLEQELREKQLNSKLDQIRLDHFQADGLPLGEVIKSLNDEAKKRDPDNRGVKFLTHAVPPTPQPEINPRENAFSTFSLNVSDVSFKLAAASLENSVMPDPASIRVEEFVNAFNYHDPAPPAGARLAFAWERARYPFAHNRDIVRFSIQTAARGREPQKPLNLVILLDSSGSMERADRVQIVREAIKVLAQQLQPQDRISVVAFARTARLWVDGMAGGKPKEFLDKVLELNPDGGTNLEDALGLGYATAARHFMANGNNRVILLTDGAANLGNVEPEVLKQKVISNRIKGIALDCFGIGWEGYNDDLLEVLSHNGDGRYGFLDRPEEAAPDFANQLAGALNVEAADVKTQVEFNPGRVLTYRQIGYARHQLTKEQFRDNTVDAAELAAAESGNALYAIEVNPEGSGPLGVVRVRYKVPATGEYVEQAWAIPYQPKVAALDQASPAMRLAVTAAAFGEWLSRSPYAGEVTPSALQPYLDNVCETYAPDSRPQRLAAMIRQARSMGGK